METDWCTLGMENCAKVKRSTLVGFDPNFQRQKLCLQKFKLMYLTRTMRLKIVFDPTDLAERRILESWRRKVGTKKV